MADLEGAKERLVEALKERTARYWELMKSWYRRRIAKEEFDGKARSLLGDENVHLHNKFLFAILVKCQTGLQPSSSNSNSHPGVGDVLSSQQQPQQRPATVTPSPHPPQVPPSPTLTKPRPKQQRLISPQLDAVPYGAMYLHQYDSLPRVQVTGRDLDTLLLCSHELLLPDKPTIHTRMLLGAWEAGLDSVSEQAADILMLALETHLKNILQTLVAHMKTWQTTRHKHFQHSFGGSSGGCGLQLGHTPHEEPECEYEGDRREAVAAMVAALSTVAAEEGQPISLFHVRDALTLNRSSIPVHSLLSCAMERALARMWHPEQEEERQRQEVEQWQRNRTPLQPLPPTDVS